CAVALANLAKLRAAAGDLVTVAYVSGTDFGSQAGPLINPKLYRELFAPFHRRVNDWIHRNTAWKTFIHSCGSIAAFLDDFIAAGFDALNPVQCSAAGMDPAELKRRFGDRIAFWGGGVDTQTTLPFGSPDDVKREVQQRLRIFSRGGGYVFNPVHNVQARVPTANLLALYEAVAEFRSIASR
ncbi:MAG: uroporphyrinogen decarboxylase family protein, partial [bacterium]